MRKILLTGVIFFSCIVLQAQEGQFYQFRMKNETKLQGSRIFIKDLVNKGKDNRLDVNALYREESNRYFSVYSGNKDKNIQNHVAWMKDSPLFTRAGSEAEADVVISGTYVLDAQTNVEENLYYERQSNVGGAIPYYEIRQTNSVSIKVIVSYRYKDKTTKYDTIQVESVYERKPGTKFQSIEDLIEKSRKSLEFELYKLVNFIDKEIIWYKFLSVKTKDKLLKEELKSAKLWLQEGDIDKLGALYAKIVGVEPGNLEAIFNLAMCYELIGNYPKAEELYVKKPDFHAKVRMKESLVLYEYLLSIGNQPVLKEFK